MGVGVALGVGGMVGQGVAGLFGAKSQSDTAREQRELAMAAAEPTVAELAAMQKQLRVADQSLARQEALVAAIDPALMEAGKQALALLKGQEAGALAPLRAAQARQSAQQEAMLRERLGGGFETSSAGIEAMTRLQESQLGQQQQAQQQTLGSLLGIAAGARPNEANLMAAGSMEAQQQAMLRQGRISAVSGNPLQPSGTAGTLGNLFGGLSNLGGQIHGQAQETARWNQLLAYKKGSTGTSGTDPSWEL